LNVSLAKLVSRFYLVAGWLNAPLDDWVVEPITYNSYVTMTTGLWALNVPP